MKDVIRQSGEFMYCVINLNTWEKLVCLPLDFDFE